MRLSRRRGQQIVISAVGVIRVVQFCKHFVGKELKLEVLAEARRMMNVYLSAGARSLASLWGCYSAGEGAAGGRFREVSWAPECGK
jgi:hypothetical protein